MHQLHTGLITHASKNKHEAWVKEKNQMLGKTKHEPVVSVDFHAKFQHAVAFIEYLADMFAETGYEDISTVDVANRQEVLLEGSATDSVKLKYLPYDQMQEVYLEYKNYYSENERHLNPSERLFCGLTTFRKAFESLNTTIKLRTARGAFETCSICDNLNDMLKNTKLQWTQDQLTIVLKLKRLHLNQQAAERRDAMLRKLKAKNTYKDSKYNVCK